MPSSIENTKLDFFLFYSYKNGVWNVKLHCMIMGQFFKDWTKGTPLKDLGPNVDVIAFSSLSSHNF
jgi:hypothetical protein